MPQGDEKHSTSKLTEKQRLCDRDAASAAPQVHTPLLDEQRIDLPA
jgi:hypothetical protein